MGANIKSRKETLLGCLTNLKNELTKPTFYNDEQTGLIFYLNQKSITYNGFTGQIFKQIQNKISDDYLSFSNFGFVFEAWTDDNLIPFEINKTFIELLEHFIIDINSTNDKNKFKIYFNEFKTKTQIVYNITS
jgi:hypothetical protein